MALSNVVNQKPAVAPAPTAQASAPTPTAQAGKPAVAPVSNTAKAGSNKASQVANANFKATGASARAKMTDAEKALEGSKSDKVAFVACLGNPAKSQPRATKDGYVPSNKPIGYAFKILEDMEVPYAPYKADARDEMQVEPVQMKMVSAGTVVNLNRVETGMFLSSLPLGGKVTGEGVEVVLTVKISKDRPAPLPVLNKIGGSIKENMEMIAENVGTPEKAVWKVKEGYEAFAPLFVKRSAGGKGSAKPKTGSAERDIAAAFRAFYAKKA